MKKYFFLFFLYASTFSQTRTVGLIFNDSSKSFKGYTLFSPINSTTTYLIDINGNKIQEWKSNYEPGQAVMLLPNGDLLRTGRLGGQNLYFNAGGAAGIVEKYDWNGNLIWTYNYYSSEYRTHHDVEVLPNGNILLISWEKKTKEQAQLAGRTNIPPNLTEVWPEKIIEVKQTGVSSGQIVWEWHAWDHIAQDADASKQNYYNISEHPELIDINSGSFQNDWLHVNSIRYNSKFDQILLSVHNTSEVWIIDHSTTTQEASTHTGGKYGKGGDILYRWGNPRMYKRGTTSDQKLFAQHDARWIDSSYVGAGNILIFNNGQGRPGGNYSSIEEISPPVTSSGEYTITGNSAFGPITTTWNYTATPTTDFYGQNISGATRLQSGNTLSCIGPSGIFIEITQDNKIVWKYINPVTQNGILMQYQNPTQNMVFKIYRYAQTYSAFTGKNLTSRGPIEIYPNSVNNKFETPKTFELFQNYPNPFNPTTNINFSIVERSNVKLNFYDATGRMVKSINEGTKEKGEHTTKWDGTNFAGEKIASGLYFYEIVTEKYSDTKKMILLK